MNLATPKGAFKLRLDVLQTGVNNKTAKIGQPSAVDLLALTSLDQLIFKLKILFT